MNGLPLFGMNFIEPWWLLLLVLAPLPLLMHWQRHRQGVPVPQTRWLTELPRGQVWGRWLGPWLRTACLVALAFALARPVLDQQETKRNVEALDIMLVIDTSRSMEARDFEYQGQRPTRMQVVKAVLADFVQSRQSDRLGMVVFGTEAYTQAPLTFDHPVLHRFLRSVDVGMAGDATAIGDGLAVATRRLQDADGKTRIIILLTDGSNTAGRVDPLAAGEAAAALGVRIYTIGVGREGRAPVVSGGRVRSQMVDVDEELLQKIAANSGGRFFRATDTESLVQVYSTIDQLEKTEREQVRYLELDEQFHRAAVPALFLIFLELLWSLSRWRSIP